MKVKISYFERLCFECVLNCNWCLRIAKGSAFFCFQNSDLKCPATSRRKRSTTLIDLRTSLSEYPKLPKIDIAISILSLTEWTVYPTYFTGFFKLAALLKPLPRSMLLWWEPLCWLTACRKVSWWFIFECKVHRQLAGKNKVHSY